MVACCRMGLDALGLVMVDVSCEIARGGRRDQLRGLAIGKTGGAGGASASAL